MSVIPMVIESNGNYERTYDLYSRLLKDRIIFVTEVNQHTANSIIGQLLFLKAENSKDPVTMYINSPGGSILDGDGILDTMDFLKSSGIVIRTIVVGKAASFGALLLLNGTKGHRMALPRSRVMIHQPRGGAQGTASDMQIELELMLKMKEEINEFVSKASGQSLKWVQDHMERDNWFRGTEALNVGLVDSIIETI